jgi:hypothetical protein
MEREIVRRSVLLVPVLAALLAGTLACSAKTAGTAVPGPDTTNGQEPTTGQTSSPRTSPTNSQAGTGALKPCELLTTSEQGQFGLGEGAEEQIGGARSCRWQKAGSYTIVVGIFDTLGLKDVVSTSETKPVTVGRHKAVQRTGGASACAIAIEVTESSRVDVSSVARGDVEKGCELALQAAELVEPKLP